MPKTCSRSGAQRMMSGESVAERVERAGADVAEDDADRAHEKLRDAIPLPVRLPDPLSSSRAAIAEVVMTAVWPPGPKIPCGLWGQAEGDHAARRGYVRPR